MPGWLASPMMACARGPFPGWPQVRPRRSRLGPPLQLFRRLGVRPWAGAGHHSTAHSMRSVDRSRRFVAGHLHCAAKHRAWRRRSCACSPRSWARSTWRRRRGEELRGCGVACETPKTRETGRRDGAVAFGRASQADCGCGVERVNAAGGLVPWKPDSRQRERRESAFQGTTARKCARAFSRIGESSTVRAEEAVAGAPEDHHRDPSEE